MLLPLTFSVHPVEVLGEKMKIMSYTCLWVHPIFLFCPPINVTWLWTRPPWMLLNYGSRLVNLWQMCKTLQRMQCTFFNCESVHLCARWNRGIRYFASVVSDDALIVFPLSWYRETYLDACAPPSATFLSPGISHRDAGSSCSSSLWGFISIYNMMIATV